MSHTDLDSTVFLNRLQMGLMMKRKERCGELEKIVEVRLD